MEENLIIHPEFHSNTTNGTGNNTFCTEWIGATFPLFQAANVFHFGAFLIPHNFAASALMMRLVLSVGQFQFVLWAVMNVCAVDIFLWNLCLLTINACHSAYLAFIIWPPLIPNQLKDLYVKLFKPLKVNRRQFKTLFKEAEVKSLNPGDVYATEDSTASDQILSILLTGKVRVTCDSAHLHYVFPNQFIDSPEWEATEKGNSENIFQVTIVAEEKSWYLTWPRPRLLKLLSTKPFLNAVMHCLIGKDITQKLYSLNEYQAKQAATNMSKLGHFNPDNLHRSHSADTVHMGSTGFVRSDVWISTQSKDSVLDSVGGSPLIKRK